MSFLTCFWLLPQNEHFSRSPLSPIRATCCPPPRIRASGSRPRVHHVLPCPCCPRPLREALLPALPAGVRALADRTRHHRRGEPMTHPLRRRHHIRRPRSACPVDGTGRVCDTRALDPYRFPARTELRQT